MLDSGFKKIINRLADLILAHTKVIMPIVLLVCVLLTVVIAINARERANNRPEIPQSELVVEDNELPDSVTIPELPLLLNEFPEVNKLINEYYDALTIGDVEIVSALNPNLGELELIRIEELARFIDYYETIDVYTKEGMTENSYVVYVCAWVKFKENDAYIPGMQSYYVMPDESGQLVIKRIQVDDVIYDYAGTVSLQDNLIDLHNKIVVEFNDMIAEDIVLEEYLAYMTAKINENVGVVLAQIQQPNITADQIRNDLNEEDDNTENNDNAQSVTTIMLARAKDVVNIRSSDSETADRLDRAIVGQEFTVLEQKGNGWSRIKYNDRDAYIKSEFLEIISEIGGSDSSASNIIGKVKVSSSSVRVRGTASTTGAVLGTVQSGQRFDLIEESNGWSKILYNNQFGFIRSDLVERE
ncbi:MAG: SH3 domain-containing protein [Lachnospiraceae bacterium]|nr:SH3 domain-containing protein [Lachnospiraceae bacterium]